MFSKILTTKSIGSCSDKNYLEKVKKLAETVEKSAAVIIGAGAGLSSSAGLTYSGERFQKYFSDFSEKYGIRDMYSGGFYPYDTLEEYWAWWSRHIYINRYDLTPGKPYNDLLELVKDKDYFIITTNVDHQFQLSGFDKKRLFYTQGDYGLWQCSKPCHNRVYDNEQSVRRMVVEQKDMKIPSELIPKCPVCGLPMTMNLRCDDTFVEDTGWYAAAERYNHFLCSHRNMNVLFLELGVGGNTPSIIKYPFWKMTAKNSHAKYICINKDEDSCPKEIEDQSVCISEDIGRVIEDCVTYSK